MRLSVALITLSNGYVAVRAAEGGVPLNTVNSSYNDVHLNYDDWMITRLQSMF